MNEKDFYKNIMKTKGSTLERISNFEKENNAILSESYKKFLLKTNGFKIKTNLLRSTIIDKYFGPGNLDFGIGFGGICNGKMTYHKSENAFQWSDKNLLEKYGLWRLAYFLDPYCGLYICIFKENNGKIYATNLELNEGNFEIIADDFDELLESFVKFESEEELDKYYESLGIDI